MGTMKIIIEQTFSSQVIDRTSKVIEITPFNRGQRQMLEARESTILIATDDIILTDTSKMTQYIDPGGASRIITLPAEDIGENHGFLIFNTADVTTELLTVKNDAGTTIGIVYPGIKASWFTSDGTNWHMPGGVGEELGDLSNLDLSGLADQNGIYYDSTTALWKPINNNPNSFALFIDEAISSLGANINVKYLSTQMYTMYSEPTPGNAIDGATLTWYFMAQKGTYKINTLGVISNSSPKIDYYIDNVLVSSAQDWYSASTVVNTIKSLTGIAIATSGMHTLRLQVNGKNPSSAYYATYLTKVWGWKTA